MVADVGGGVADDLVDGELGFGVERWPAVREREDRFGAGREALDGAPDAELVKLGRAWAMQDLVGYVELVGGHVGCCGVGGCGAGGVAGRDR